MEVKLPGTASGEIILEKMLSMNVLEWEVSRVVLKKYGTKELEARKPRNSLVGL